VKVAPAMVFVVMALPLIVSLGALALFHAKTASAAAH
jgi:hypothetical protein